MRHKLAFVLTLALAVMVSQARASDQDLWETLIAKLTRDGYPEQDLRHHFGHPDISYLPDAMGSKLKTLFKIKFEPPEPPRTKEKPKVYASALTKERVLKARSFLKANRSLFRAVDKEYGVPPEVAVSILSVETRLGDFLGADKAMAVLASMARDGDREVVRRHFADRILELEQEAWLEERAGQKSQWAYEELKSLLDYAELNRVQPVGVPGSMYGAIGLCQFMPSNALRFGVDGDRDGKVDLFNLSDAAHSLANYLKANGWKKGLKNKGQRKVIYQYNHSETYVNTVLELAKKIRQ